ncbi:hypothetical protein [Clostridium saccharoperbutylacetonicum]|uniref:hypothetical protein n=1 Tax=Clostridium saccharoperbutylacetonicum TaxID=36745 RepID=UPI0039EA4712
MSLLNAFMNDEEMKKDCEEVKDLFKIYGYDISIEEAYELWSDYSQSIYFASWMPVGLSNEEFKDEMLPIAKELLEKKGYKFDE